MGSNNWGGVRVDAILHHRDEESDRTSIELTLYLPWGHCNRNYSPAFLFRPHYVAHFFDKNDAGDISDRLAALDAEQDRVFVHLRKAGCYVAGEVVRHDSLRIRLSDVSAWTVKGVEEPRRAPPTP